MTSDALTALATQQPTLSELINMKMQRREALRAELFALEQELIEAGAILATTVTSARMLRRRGRSVKGDSGRDRILRALADGNEMSSRDIKLHVPLSAASVSAQLSRMTIEGDLERVRHGHYRLASQ